MADLIDRERLLKELYSDIKCKNTRFLNCVRLAPAVNRWIPCSERLPEQTGRYLVWLDSGIVDIAEFYTFADFVQKEIANNYWNKESKVLYWMPLPTEPESEVHNDEQRG